MAYMLHYDIVVNKFKLQSYYYVHFETNTLGKDMLNSTTTNDLLQG